MSCLKSRKTFAGISSIIVLIVFGSCEFNIFQNNGELAGKTFYLADDDSVSISCGDNTTTLKGWIWQQYEGNFPSYYDNHNLHIKVADNRKLQFEYHWNYINADNDVISVCL